MFKGDNAYLHPYFASFFCLFVCFVCLIQAVLVRSFNLA